MTEPTCAAAMNQFNEVVIAGSRDDLRRVARTLAQRGEIQCDSRPRSPDDPYRVTLGVIEITEVPNGRVRIRVDAESGRLAILGDAYGLDLFSANVTGLAEDGIVGEHQHIDYFPDHLWLAEDSAPLVLELVDEA